MEPRIIYDRCPLCSSDSIAKSLTGDCGEHPMYNKIIPRKMQWMDCNDCGHQFIDGYFTDDAAEIIFQNTQENQKVGFQIEQQRVKSADIIEKVLPYKSSGTWLDVGFGNGSLLFTAEEFGFHPIGVDLRNTSVRSIKQLGFEAYCQLVETIDFESEIAVVSMMDVLEHIPYPKDVLLSLHSKMEEGGCITLSMPNTENLVWKLMTKNNANPYLGELEHYHNFSRSRLFSLLEECGFNPVRYGISKRYRVCMEVVAVRN